MSIADRHAVQQRTVRVLAAAQVLTGIGVGVGVAAGSLIVSDITGSASLAGLAQTFGVVGAAVAAVPLARISATKGRRHGLVTGLWVAAVGGMVVISGAATSLLPLVLLGTCLVGVASAVSLQARYAATDLASEHHAGRDLSLVVWATTVGAVLGPNLMEPAGLLADPFGLPRLAGAYVMTAVALALSGSVILSQLRPDPLLLSRDHSTVDEGPGRVRLRSALSVVRRSRDATYGLLALTLGHSVMVMVMVMTPVHMQHVDASLRIVGLVISVHILGMFAFSPLVGTAVDRLGPKPVITTGVGIFGCAVLLAGTAAADSVGQLGAGLFLLGLGWSCTLVAGSALLSKSVATADRPAAQGAGDTVMNIAAAVGGVAAGVVVSIWSYGWLNVLAGLVIVPLLVRRRETASTSSAS